MAGPERNSSHSPLLAPATPRYAAIHEESQAGELAPPNLSLLEAGECSICTDALDTQHFVKVEADANPSDLLTGLHAPCLIRWAGSDDGLSFRHPTRGYPVRTPLTFSPDAEALDRLPPGEIRDRAEAEASVECQHLNAAWSRAFARARLLVPPKPQEIVDAAVAGGYLGGIVGAAAGCALPLAAGIQNRWPEPSFFNPHGLYRPDLGRALICLATVLPIPGAALGMTLGGLCGLARPFCGWGLRLARARVQGLMDPQIMANPSAAAN